MKNIGRPGDTLFLKRNIYTKIIFNNDMLTSVAKSCLHSWPAGTLPPSIVFISIRRVRHSRKHVQKAHISSCRDIYLRIAIRSVHFFPIDGRGIHSVYHKPYPVRVGSTVNDVTLPRGVGEVQICVGVWLQGKVEGVRNIPEVLTLA